jgi:quercetin dioxygenase-like cupin family protein
MIEVWQQQFFPTYTKNEGKIKVLNDIDVPRPENFKPDQNFRSTVVFDSGERAGDHYHQIRNELFVGIGSGMQLLIEDLATKQGAVYNMNPVEGDGQLIVFYIPAGVPHAVRNLGPGNGFLIEFADHLQEKVDYKLSID